MLGADCCTTVCRGGCLCLTLGEASHCCRQHAGLAGVVLASIWQHMVKFTAGINILGLPQENVVVDTALFSSMNFGGVTSSKKLNT